MRTLADLQRLAVSSGCTLVRAELRGGELVGHFDCPDINDGRPMATAALLEGLTRSDAEAGEDDFDPELVAMLQAKGPRGAPAAIHRYVMGAIRFQEEEGEQFQSPRATLRLGYGDCDDHVRTIVGLASAVGVPGRLVYFLQDGQPAHVAAQLHDGSSWRWAETTIPARFGEHPFRAFARTGGGARPDLDGTAVLLTEGPALGRIGAMSEVQVARVGTPVTAQAVLNALAVAWPTVIGSDPGSALQVLVAQSAFETGAWKAVWNNNLGNVKYTPGAGTDWFSMTASEGSGANTTMVGSKWRSYDSLAAGAAAWLAVLAHGYSTALGYAQQGDVADFVQALSSGGYFTGDEATYAAGVAQYYRQFSVLSPSTALGTAEEWGETAVSSVTETPMVSQTDAAIAVGGGLAAGVLVGLLFL